ncbi:MAG: hypothetical protein AAF467_02885 [Actinomycetota bacterium]
MTIRSLTLLSLGVGIASVLALLVGLRSIGGVLALVQLCGLVGAPLALILNRQLRSRSVVAVLSVALSIGMSALAAQSLIWFDLATRPALVATATAYGLVLALLLAERDAAEGTGRARELDA